MGIEIVTRIGGVSRVDSLGTAFTSGTEGAEVLVVGLVVGVVVVVGASVVVVTTVVVTPEVTDEATLELSKTPLSPPQAASSTAAIADTANHLALIDASSQPTTLGTPAAQDRILSSNPLCASRPAPR
jgi:hypothetical protein